MRRRRIPFQSLADPIARFARLCPKRAIAITKNGALSDIICKNKPNIGPARERRITAEQFKYDPRRKHENSGECPDCYDAEPKCDQACSQTTLHQYACRENAQAQHQTEQRAL